MSVFAAINLDGLISKVFATHAGAEAFNDRTGVEGPIEETILIGDDPGRYVWCVENAEGPRRWPMQGNAPTAGLLMMFVERGRAFQHATDGYSVQRLTYSAE